MLPKPTGSAPSLRGLQRTVMGNLAHMEPEVVNAVMGGAAISDPPLPEKLRSLEVPSMILAWKHDFAHPVESAEVLAELLPEASLHVAEEHAQAEEWPGLVRDFLFQATAGYAWELGSDGRFGLIGGDVGWRRMRAGGRQVDGIGGLVSYVLAF